MKSKSIILTGVCLAALAFTATPGAFAKEKKSKAEASASSSPTEGAKAGRGIPYHGKISAVGSSAKTFTITSKKGDAQVYKMTDATKYKKDGQEATMADVTADQEVRGQYMKTADGSMEVKSVMLGAKPKKAGGGKKKDKAAGDKEPDTTKAGNTTEASPQPSATP